MIAFREELIAAGIPFGDYNLPDWDQTAEGMRALLPSLFRLTPPTAMIFSDYDPVMSAISFFANRGVDVPRSVSLVSMTDPPSIEWHIPSLSHFRVNWDGMAREIIRWAGDVSRGRPQRPLRTFDAVFVPGATIGPPPKA